MLVLISYRYQYWYQYYRYLDESRKHYNDIRVDKLRKWMDELLEASSIESQGCFLMMYML